MSNILKCKMCGGDIEVSQDMTVGKCLFCGSTMTLPRIDSDKKARLFNRANEYRLNNEFDKAYDAYKTIAEEDSQEAEAYWGMVLSEYGVEYVEDPKTGKRIPTCHRTRLQPITSSVDYKQAIQCADAERKFAYQDEAEQLNKIQKEIMAISSKEEPYSVFICYKETNDITGERTKDSVLAQDIYDALTAKGIRTFFARISLEDKLGQNYEPFIFSALSSAKVMIHVTTSAENSEAVWVKNEWSRYIDFMLGDKSKSLIPVYLDMSPYELPDQMQKLQAQDMSKVGAIQDLVRGIQKLIGESQIQLGTDQEVLQKLVKERKEQEAELKRKVAAQKAQEEFEKAEQERREQERQERIGKSILFWKKHWPKLLIATIVLIIGIVAIIIFTPIVMYNKACKKLENGDYEAAYNIFSKLGDYKNSKENKDTADKGAKEMMALTGFQEVVMFLDREDTQEAVELYESLCGDEEIMNVVNNSKDTREKYVEASYQVALNKLENGDVENAKKILVVLEDYNDSNERILECNYHLAQEMLATGDVDYVIRVLSSNEIKETDKNQLIQEIAKYLEDVYQNKGFDDLMNIYGKIPLNIARTSPEINYTVGVAFLDKEEWKNAVEYLELANGVNDSNNKLLLAKYGFCKENFDELDNNSVATYLDELALSNFEDSSSMREEYNAKKSITGWWIGPKYELSFSNQGNWSGNTMDIKAGKNEYYYDKNKKAFIITKIYNGNYRYKAEINGESLVLSFYESKDGTYDKNLVGTYTKKYK